MIKFFHKRYSREEPSDLYYMFIVLEFILAFVLVGGAASEGPSLWHKWQAYTNEQSIFEICNVTREDIRSVTLQQIDHHLSKVNQTTIDSAEDIDSFCSYINSFTLKGENPFIIFSDLEWSDDSIIINGKRNTYRLKISEDGSAVQTEDITYFVSPYISANELISLFKAN